MKRLLKCYVLTLHKLFRLSLAALMLLAGLFLAYEMKRSYDRPPYDGDETRKGNLNGIPIGIPRKYLYYFPVEYIDKSIWEPPKPGDIPYGERTYDHQIAAFSLYLHWPDRQPKNGHNFVNYLVLDKNHNQQIDDGSELFGNHTRLADGSTASHGFEALQALDSNADGQIDQQDAAFAQLNIWQDKDMNSGNVMVLRHL